jgi:hypothetical protein
VKRLDVFSNLIGGILFVFEIREYAYLLLSQLILLRLIKKGIRISLKSVLMSA